MPNLSYGYREGPRRLVTKSVKASASIAAGDMVKDNGGYVEACTAGDIPIGFSAQTVTGGSSDGDITCLVDTSTESVYCFPPDAGTVAQSLDNKTVDVGGAQSIDIDASTDDALTIVEVDADNNLLFVKRNGAGIAGVV
jgi:hypothetical protein